MSDERRIEIYFDETDQSIEIRTPGGQSIRLSDALQSITLEVSGGSKVALGPEGIRLESTADVVISASGEVRIDAMAIASSAKTRFSAHGDAAMQLSTSGKLTINGALVNIN